MHACSLLPGGQGRVLPIRSRQHALLHSYHLLVCHLPLWNSGGTCVWRRRTTGACKGRQTLSIKLPAADLRQFLLGVGRQTELHDISLFLGGGEEEEGISADCRGLPTFQHFAFAFYAHALFLPTLFMHTALLPTYKTSLPFLPAYAWVPLSY